MVHYSGARRMKRCINRCPQKAACFLSKYHQASLALKHCASFHTCRLGMHCMANSSWSISKETTGNRLEPFLCSHHIFGSVSDTLSESAICRDWRARDTMRQMIASPFLVRQFSPLILLFCTRFLLYYVRGVIIKLLFIAFK